MIIEGSHNLSRRGDSTGSDVVRHREITAKPAFLYAVVLAFGAVGAILRYAIQLALPGGAFPAGTLLINLVGCYIIYIVYDWFDRRVHIPHSIARGIGVGLVGAFTTLSAFCTESLAMLHADACLLFAGYVSTTVFGTFIASLAGWATCALLARRRLRRLRARRAKRHLELQCAAGAGDTASAEHVRTDQDTGRGLSQTC